MAKKQPGSIALSVLLTFLILLSGTFFVNAYAARSALQPENIRTEIENAGLTAKIEQRIEQLSQVSSGLAGKAQEVVDSPELDQLLDRYSEYVSDYLLTGSTEKQLGNEELSGFLTSFLSKWTEGLGLGGDMLQKLVDNAVESVDLASVFPRVDQMIPEPAGGLILFALNSITLYVSLGLTVLFLILLLFAARPRRFAGFVGAGAALTGLLTIAASDLVVQTFADLFDNKMVIHLLDGYGSKAEPIGMVLAVAGAALLVVGIIIAVVTRRMSRNRYW